VHWNLYGSSVDIEVLFVADCPHVERAVERAHEALTAAGVAGAVRTRRIDSTEDAAASRMRGSPTILIDGRDHFVGPAGDGSLSCRLYRSAEGFDGAPTVEAIVEAITA
jgi:hypothetical protein